MATPHRGSFKISWGKIFDRIARFAYKRSNSELLKILVPNCSDLFELLKNFITICEHMQLVCFHEEKARKIGLVCRDLCNSTHSSQFMKTSGLIVLFVDCSPRHGVF